MSNTIYSEIVPLGADGTRSYPDPVQSTITILEPQVSLDLLNQLLPANINNGALAFVNDSGDSSPALCYYDLNDNEFKKLTSSSPSASGQYLAFNIPSVDASIPNSTSTLMIFSGSGTLNNVIFVAESVSSTVKLEFIINADPVGDLSNLNLSASPSAVKSASSPNTFNSGDILSVYYTGGGSATNLSITANITFNS